MSEATILAVDLGTSGMKVALITVSGKAIGWESEPVHLIITSDGGAEQSPDEWWQAFLPAAGRLIKKNQDAGQNVIAVCASTQGEGTVAVDKEGNALGNAILWMDMRRAPYLRKQLNGLIIEGSTFAALTGVADNAYEVATPKARRHVVFVNRQYYVLLDEVAPASPAAVELRFHTYGSLAARPRGGWVVTYKGAYCDVVPATGTSLASSIEMPAGWTQPVNVLGGPFQGGSSPSNHVRQSS